MSDLPTTGNSMGRPKSDVPKDSTVRITGKAREIATRAAGLANTTVPDWVCKAIEIQGDLEIEAFMAAREKEKSSG